MKQFNLLPILFSLLLLLNSCGDDPSPVGSALLKDEDLITLTRFDSYTDSVHQTSGYFQSTPLLGGASRLLLGNINGNLASVLMKFRISLPDSLKKPLLNDSLSILSARVRLFPYYVLGPSGAFFDFTAHKINSSWTSASFASDSLDILDYGTEDISSGKEISDTLVDFRLNSEVVLSWMKAEADENIDPDNGLLLSPDLSSGRILGFQAVSVVARYQLPVLEVIYRVGDFSPDTVQFNPYLDVHVVRGTIPFANAEYSPVQGGVAVNSGIYFDISKIPPNSVINSALLEIRTDSLLNLLGKPSSDSLTVAFAVDSTAREIDSTTALFLGRSKDIFSGNITRYVQRWINGESNQGLILSVTNQISNLDLYYLFGSSARAEYRPRLKVLYAYKK